MLFSDKKNNIRWVFMFISFFIVSAILWNTYIFFQIFKIEERSKMNLLAHAQKTLINASEDTDVDLPLEIFKNNRSIPIVLTENDTIVSMVNVKDEIENSEYKSKLFLLKLKKQNNPIIIEYVPGKFQKLYYGNSDLVNKLKYYSLALLLIIGLFGGVVFSFYKSAKIATQNKLWVGMAKETAHQIGTPLSSLIGWVEILKSNKIDNEITIEIEKDIDRLKTITDRFSKIGSRPKLEIKDIVNETKEVYSYLKSRYSNQVNFSFESPQYPIRVLLNATLHGWTIENIIKNAIDAMKGKGELLVSIEEKKEIVKIRVKDTGIGISKNSFKSIFEPGFTTKKRGWGLGLTLTKRIVEIYHRGSVKVLYSEVGKGTVMQISYKRII